MCFCIFCLKHGAIWKLTSTALASSPLLVSSFVL
ncbi:hypothetical protein OESDEN_22976 [Oesophagostomum dentatum]|uniref:Uncharacterized protein n=1 Tax=Oesophagostomum dentatum TaxID=61180 RepID=A0A0B1RXJ2_OESDE|nr:hypothetical protein OESDEN_22976 [Oesophagostomum dentatum]